VGDRPALQQRTWAAVNEPLQGSELVNGYGTRQVLDWLVSGQLLDHGRLPVVTVFAALGFGLSIARLGRTTFGSLVDLVPGSADLFFRRFMMGVQLASLLLAGRGAAWLAAGCARLIEAWVPRWPSGLRRPTRMVAPALVAVDAPTGTHYVVFRFHGYGDYPELLALSGLTLVIVGLAPMCVRRTRWRRSSACARRARQDTSARRGRSVDRRTCF